VVLPHSESTANLLIDNGSNFPVFSEYVLISKENWSDFDSAIPRFESWRPSHQVRSLHILRPLLRGSPPTRLFALAGESPGPEIDIFSAHSTENLRALSGYWPISGETSRRLGSIALRGRARNQRWAPKFALDVAAPSEGALGFPFVSAPAFAQKKLCQEVCLKQCEAANAKNWCMQKCVPNCNMTRSKS
jgi:hypothetical protein